MWFVTENIDELRRADGPTNALPGDSNVREQISFSGFEEEWVSLGACFEIVIFGIRENIQKAENVIDNFCRWGTHGLQCRNLGNREMQGGW